MGSCTSVTNANMIMPAANLAYAKGSPTKDLKFCVKVSDGSDTSTANTNSTSVIILPRQKNSTFRNIPVSTSVQTKADKSFTYVMDEVLYQVPTLLDNVENSSILVRRKAAESARERIPLIDPLVDEKSMSPHLKPAVKFIRQPRVHSVKAV